MIYSDADIDEAIGRIAADVARRSGQPDFHGPAMEALVNELRCMEAARRGGDFAGAMVFATTAHAALETYRPTNATSRAKAVLVEVLVEVLAHGEQPPAT